MKTFFKSTGFILLFLIFSVVTFGQENKQFSDEINGVNVSPPTFAGILVEQQKELGSINEYLMNHIEYPEKAQEKAQEGTEVVQFVVTTKGEVADFNIINSVSPEIDQEVIRVLKTTSKMWKPGLNNGTPVAMEKEISAAFYLNMKGIHDPDVTNDFANLAKHYFNRAGKMFFIREKNMRALKYYDKAVRYMPNDKALLVNRGMCRYELGNEDGACQDWNRIKDLGGLEADAYLDNFCHFKGYAEMANTLQEKK